MKLHIEVDPKTDACNISSDCKITHDMYKDAPIYTTLALLVAALDLNIEERMLLSQIILDPTINEHVENNKTTIEIKVPKKEDNNEE